jgi:hypothetical protein
MDQAGRPINSSKRSIDTSSFLTIPRANPIYLNQSGDFMEGSLDMNNNKIINIIDPMDPKDCSNKAYVDKSANLTKTYVDNSLTTIRRTLKTDVDHQLEEKLVTLKEPISKESVKYLEYDYILNVLKPKFWFTSFLPEVFNKGIKEKTNVSSVNSFIKFNSNDYVISEYEFGTEYTFIGVVRRITQGRVFTSLTGINSLVSGKYL